VLEEIQAQARANALRDSPKLVPLTVWVARREREALERFARADGSTVESLARRGLVDYAEALYTEAAATVQRYYDEAYADASRELETA
jgi:hypothetical protein